MSAANSRLRLAVFFAAVTIALVFSISNRAARYGPEVGSRFLERGEPYIAAELRTFVATSARDARGYAIPVLFPLDLLFMLCLGGFLGLASVEAAQAVDRLKAWAWLFAVAPALYVAADLAEDVLLARMLLSPDAISDDAVRIARGMTQAKLATSIFAVGQTIILSAVATLRGAGRGGPSR
jgi:hypothetical protein